MKKIANGKNSGRKDQIKEKQLINIFFKLSEIKTIKVFDVLKCHLFYFFTCLLLPIAFS